MGKLKTIDISCEDLSSFLKAFKGVIKFDRVEFDDASICLSSAVTEEHFMPVLELAKHFKLPADQITLNPILQSPANYDTIRLGVMSPFKAVQLLLALRDNIVEATAKCSSMADDVNTIFELIDKTNKNESDI